MEIALMLVAVSAGIALGSVLMSGDAGDPSRSDDYRPAAGLGGVFHPVR